jgi:hypothetical protein
VPAAQPEAHDDEPAADTEAISDAPAPAGPAQRRSEPGSTATPEPVRAESTAAPEPPATAGQPPVTVRRPGPDLHRAASTPSVAPAQAAPAQRNIEPASSTTTPQPVSAESTAAPEPPATAGPPPVTTHRPGPDPRRTAPWLPSVAHGEAPSAAPLQRNAEPVSAESTAAPEPPAAAGPAPVTARRPGLDLDRAPATPSVAPAEAAPVQRNAEPVGTATPQPVSAATPEPPLTTHRPGPDPRRTAPWLPSVAHGAPPSAAPLQRSAETVRRPGLDVHRALSAHRPLVASRGPGPGAAYAHAPESFEGPYAPAPGSALQLAASLAHPEAAAPAAPPTPPPALVALSSPPEPPAVVQRVNGDGPRNATRERLSEAPDDDLQELAGRIYDHIRSRLRTELLIERERAGLLADRY